VKYCCLSRPHALAAGDKAAERAGKRDSRKLIDRGNKRTGDGQWAVILI